MTNKNMFEIKGEKENPVILNKVNNKYRVSYFEEDKAKSKDFNSKEQAEVFANEKTNPYSN